MEIQDKREYRQTLEIEITTEGKLGLDELQSIIKDMKIVISQRGTSVKAITIISYGVIYKPADF